RAAAREVPGRGPPPGDGGSGRGVGALQQAGAAHRLTATGRRFHDGTAVGPWRADSRTLSPRISMTRFRPADGFRSVVFDCDSTLSRIEGIDELAGPRLEEIRAMTDAAMQGAI